jgi:hypothetical protein
MSTLAEIEAVLPKLSAGDLARVEAVLHRLRHGREADARFDGRPWPSSREEIAAMLAELDGLPPVLTAEDAGRFAAWQTAERERQKALFHHGGDGLHTLFT